MGYKRVMNDMRGSFTLQKLVCRQNEPTFHLLLSQKRVNGEILRLNALKEHCIFIISQNQNTFLDLHSEIFSFIYRKLIFDLSSFDLCLWFLFENKEKFCFVF